MICDFQTHFLYRYISFNLIDGWGLFSLQNVSLINRNRINLSKVVLSMWAILMAHWCRRREEKETESFKWPRIGHKQCLQKAIMLLANYSYYLSFLNLPSFTISAFVSRTLYFLKMAISGLFFVMFVFSINS